MNPVSGQDYGPGRWLTLYERRWHGLARWKIEDWRPTGREFVVEQVALGWWRPPRGWRCQRVRIGGGLAT